MRPLFSLREALADPHLLGGERGLGDDSWAGWRATLLASVGEPLNEAETAAFRQLTRRAPPGHAVGELWAVAGRRGGKSKALSALVTYLSACCSWERVSEKLRALVVAPDMRQAQDFLHYCSEFVTHSPLLAPLIRRQTSDSLELSDPAQPRRRGVTILVRAANFKRIRSMTCVCIALDECAFFASDDAAAVPDVEVLTAVKPMLLTTKGMLLVASSPFGQRGELYRMHKEFFGVDDPHILVAHGTTLDLHPSADRAAIEAAIRADPVRFEAEYLARFRATADNLLTREAIEACVDINVRERAPERVAYTAFADVSGGINDAMALAVTHAPDERNAVLDCIDVVKPQPGKPLSPAAVLEQFARTLARYGVFTVFGDDYGKQWVVEGFAARGISYEPPRRKNAEAKMAASELYLEAVPLINSRSVRLIDHAVMIDQLCQLERSIVSSGRERVTHPSRGHDDVANAVCGGLVMALQRGAVMPTHRLQSHAIGGDFDPLASADERAAAAHREEARGYFTGPGWAPTWHGDGESQQTLGGN
jgi:hypothetical protein